MPLDIEKLKKWFLSEKRELPWREAATPYSVWVSEVMLQQTQVSVVIPYFEEWMRRFPTIQALAEADVKEVIKVWEGLGYYSRARNLHDGAKYVMQHCGGKLPENEKDLGNIKGIGPYTLGAILSFAFKKRAAAVDGNVLRVLSRVECIQEDISKPKTIAYIQKEALALIPDTPNHESWIINEALIELGAVICSKKPKCGSCPVQHSCKAYKNGLTEELPFKSKKSVTINLHRAVAVIYCQEHVLIRKGKPGEIMFDLHEFPFLELQNGTQEDYLSLFKDHFKVDLKNEKELSPETHSFTQYRVKLTPIAMQAEHRFVCRDFFWHRMDRLKDLPFSSGHRRVLNSFLGQFS